MRTAVTRSAPSPARPSRLTPARFRLVLGAIAVAASLGAASARWQHSLSVDEPFTARTIHLPWSEQIDAFRHDNTPTTYVLLAGWRRVAGESEMRLRAMFIAAFALAIVLTGAATRRAGGPAAGLLAAVLVGSSSNVGLMHAATIRPYALLMATVATALWLTLRAWGGAEHARGAWWTPALLALVHLAGLFTHPIYLFFVVAWTAAIVVAAPRSRLMLAAAAGLAVVLYGVLWWPMLSATLNLPATRWMAPPAPVDLWNAWLGIWGNRTGFILIGALLALALSTGLDRAGWIDRPLAFAMVCGAATLVIPFAVSFWRPVFHLTRTPTLALPVLAMVVALAIARLGTARLTFAFVLVVAAAGVQFVVATRRFGDPSPTRQSVRAVLQRAQCEDSLVLAGLSYAAVSYYLDRLGAPPCLRVETFPAEIANHPGWTDDVAARNEPDALNVEARSLAERLAARRRPVWLFAKVRGVGQSAGEAVTGALSDRLGTPTVLPLRGAFFDIVRVYAPP